MDNLLFYALIVALLYYFLVYLPAQKKAPQPSPHPDPFKPTYTSQSTQTDFIKSPSRSKTSLTELTETVITEYEPGPTHAEFPSAQTVNCPGPETNPDQKDLENTLDFLIKGMADLSKEIDKI